MKARERALEKMKAGASWKDLKDEFGQSTLYTAFSDYFAWAEGRVRNLLGKIQESKASSASFREEEQKLRFQVGVLSRQVDELESIGSHLREDEEALSFKFKSKEEQLRDLEQRVEDLREQGCTEEVFSRICRIEFGDGDELLARIETYEIHEELKKAVTSHRDELDRIKTAVEQENQALDEIKNEVNSWSNLLDEWKRKAWMWKEAQNVMLSFFKDGYDTATLIGLKRAVNVLVVKGNPRVTVKRLLDALGDMKELTEIEATLRQRKRELTRTQKELDKAKGSLKAVKENILDEIESTLEVSSRHLRALNEIAVNKIQKQGTQTEERFKRLSEDLNTQAEALRENAETAIRMTGDEYRREIHGLNEAAQQCLGDYRSEVQKWGKMKEEMGAYAGLIEYGYVLMGVLKNPEAITKIPPEVMVQIVERLHLYVLHKFPDVYTTPSPNAADKEYSLNQYMRCRLSSLVEWLKDDLNIRLLSGGV